MTEITAPVKPVANGKGQTITSQETLQQVQAKLAQVGEYGQKGELDKATALCKEILVLMPDNPQAQHFLGMIALQRNETDAAIAQFEKVAPVMAFSAEVHLHLGVAYGQKGEMDKAIQALKQSLRLNSKFGEAHYNLGLALLRTGDLLGAQTHYQRAAELNPDNPMVQMGLGNLYSAQNKIPQALAAYELALKLQPNYPECYFNMAFALEKDGRIQQALESYYKALELNSSYIDALNSAGALLMRIKQYDQAIAHFKTIITQVPKYLPAIRNCGDALNAKHNYQEAAAVLKQGLEHYPDQVELLSGYFTAIRNDCAWQVFDSARNTLIEKANARMDQNLPVGISPQLAITLGLDAQTECLIAKNYAKFAYQHLPRHQFDFSKRDKNPNRKLKMGYVFGKLQDQVFIPSLNREQFSVYAYCLSADELNTIANRVDHFVDLSYLTSAEITHRIYQDEIDILVDLTGYSADARPEIFAAKPAPVQISYLGHMGTSGTDFMDYYLGDPVITPESYEAFYTESLLRLPHVFCASESAPNTPIATKSQCGLPEDKFIFSSHCTAENLEPKVFAAWLKILAQVPESVLWLCCETSNEARLRQFAQQNNIDPTRLIFTKQLDQYPHVDLFLDTLVYNSHTALDALGMNVPVLCVLGNSTASRTSASFLTALKLEDLIASDIKDYTQMAVSLAQQPEQLAALKQRLINNKSSSVLFDVEKFTRDLEMQYQNAWRESI